MLKLNCGLSYPEQSESDELEKIQLANKYNVDYVSIISVDKDRVKSFWEKVANIKNKKFTLASALLYECVMFNEDIIETIQRHYDYGVRAMTLHTTPIEMIRDAVSNGFIVNSRGGIFSSEIENNPILEKWDEIVEFCLSNGIEIFIGTSLRPGECTDELNEWTIKDLCNAVAYYDSVVEKWRNKTGNTDFTKAPVQLEALGHVRAWNLKEYQDICTVRNICTMGPLLTDAVNGFDEINAIIGYTIAREYLNIKTICMLSRKEHIELPNVEDVEDEIQKWKVAEAVNDCRYQNGNLAGHKKEAEVLSTKSKQRTQCSAHYNIFGVMNIASTCNVCGNKCPLLSEKLKRGENY